MTYFTDHKIYLGTLLGFMLAVSCASDDYTRVQASNARVETASLAAADGTRVTEIDCDEPQIDVIQTIERDEEVHGGNDFYNDFFTPLAHYSGNTYWVWRDPQFNIFVSKIAENGHMESHRLGGEGYQARRNSHNLFSLALDQDGYIHVTGDMQNGPNDPADVKDRDRNLYPKEFRGASILYWRSNSPENVNDGFEFRGHESDERKIPAYSANGIRFFRDNNGELFSSAAVKAIKGSNTPGSRGIGLYRYHNDTQRWETIGAPMPGNSHPVFFSEFGSEGNIWFNGYFHAFMFDAANRLHFATPVATTPNRKDYDRIIYAYSGDNGSTWKKANGVQIKGLPMRGADGEANQGDVVGSSSDRYQWQLKLVPDQNGRPGIRAKNIKTDKNVWLVWDGKQWTLDNSVNNQKDVPQTGYVGPGGKMILHRNDSPLKMQCAGVYSEQLNTEVLDKKDSPLERYNKLLHVDEFALRNTGSVYGIAGSKKKGIQSLVKITYKAIASSSSGKATKPDSSSEPSTTATKPESSSEPITTTKEASRPVVSQPNSKTPVQVPPIYADLIDPEFHPDFRRMVQITSNLHPNDTFEEVVEDAANFVWGYSQNAREFRYMMSIDDETLQGMLKNWGY